MGALTGNTVQSTYLDLVQLGKSGAGLPSHAGKEAALYDGAGYQILGRTAQRHWLDPHPDAAAFSETWEFSTKGDMNQTALEAAGWTFTNCSGAVSEGVLWLSNSAGSGVGWSKAFFTVNFTGDFDIVITTVVPMDYGIHTTYGTTFCLGGGGVGRTAADVAHHVYSSNLGMNWTALQYYTGAFTTGGGTLVARAVDGPMGKVRVWRTSGNVNLCSAMIGYPGQALREDETVSDYLGWTDNTTVADANTFNRLFVAQGPATDQAAGASKFIGISSIRRFQ